MGCWSSPTLQWARHCDLDLRRRAAPAVTQRPAPWFLPPTPRNSAKSQWKDCARFYQSTLLAARCGDGPCRSAGSPCQRLGPPGAPRGDPPRKRLGDGCDATAPCQPARDPAPAPRGAATRRPRALRASPALPRQMLRLLVLAALVATATGELRRAHDVRVRGPRHAARPGSSDARQRRPGATCGAWRAAPLTAHTNSAPKHPAPCLAPPAATCPKVRQLGHCRAPRAAPGLLRGGCCMRVCAAGRLS